MHKSAVRHFTHIFLPFFLLTSFTLPVAAQQDSVADYMHVPGPLNFNNVTYNLAWSSKPTDNYFKQQYLQAGDSLAQYHKVLVLDLLLDTIKPKSLAYYKIRSLQQRKKVDAVTDYHLIQSPDSSEYIVDFVESQNTQADNYVEWNAYRYKSIKNADGRKGVLLFGISLRAYSNQEGEFMGKLRDIRQEVINQLMNYKLPVIKAGL